MAENTSGGLPNIGIDMTKLPLYGQDDERLQELNQAQRDAIDALQHRYDNPNWFKVAAGFAKPQLGGFLASLGSASEAMGENVEQERANKLPVSQMKLQLAQSNMLLGASQKVNNEVKKWNAEHPGMTPPADVIRTWEAMSPENPTVKALKSELDTQQKQQTLNVQRIHEKQAAGLPLDQNDLSILHQSPEGQPRTGQPPLPGNADVANPQAGNTPTGAQPKAKGSVSQDDLLNGFHTLENIPPGQKAKNSSAMGPGGMIDSTREGLQKKYHLPDGYGTDPTVTAQYEKALLKDNEDMLKKNNLDANATNHRLAWWFGNEAPKLANADPTTKIGTILSPEVLKANGLDPKMSVGKLTARIQGDLADHGINPNHMVGDAQPTGGGTPSATQPLNVNPTTGYYNHSVPMPKTGGMAPLDKEAIMAAYKENSAKLEAPLAAKIANQATVFGDNPTYNQLKNNYTQSSNLIEKNPEIADKVFRLVAQQGPVLNALNEGLGVHAGNFTANINVPVKAWMEGGLSKTEAAVADKMFSSLVSIALGNMKQQGYDMNKIPQGEFMQALSQYVNPNMSALTAANKLHKDAAHFDHQKENYDQMIKERSTKADSNSLTPFTDIQNNSTELRKIAKKHQMIQDQYDAEYQKKIDELKAKEKQKNGGK